MTLSSDLVAVLEKSRALGLLGPGGVDSHIRHARGFVELVAARADRPVLDLGSGGGVPGLVIASEVDEAELVLVDAQARRCAFLRESVRRLGVSSRVTVIDGRAEDLARSPSLREHFGTVVARSFGRPSVTAECAVGFLEPEGHLLVSEPPGADGRWHRDPLAELGLEVGPRHEFTASEIQELRRAGPLPDVPRAVGVPARRPLF